MLIGQHKGWHDNSSMVGYSKLQQPNIANIGTMNVGDHIPTKVSVLNAAQNDGGKCLNISTPVINSTWIIDSGATDHMIFDSRQVSSLKQSSQKTVSTANGNTIPIVGEGSLTITDNLQLDSVLFVPSLNYNLLSVSQITTALSCIVIFWPDYCVIKDIQTRQTIGCGIKRGKLYYLDLQSQDSDKLRQVFIADGTMGEKKQSEIWLWHRRLGHASFGYLKRINENDVFKQDWRSRSKVQVLQYIFLKWLLAFLVGLLTGVIATLINLAIENIAGYKLVAVVKYIDQGRYSMGFIFMAGANFVLTLVAAVLCVCFAPTAAGPGIPEIKAYLNGVDTPDMFGATTLIVKIIGSIGAVSAGLDLGKEGPLVHIGSCIASLLGQGGPESYRIRWRWLRYFNNDRDRRDLITCGASSGVCAAFRAPVGGVLFSLEEVATWWRSALLWRTFFSTAVVVVVLRAVMEYCKSGNCGLFGRGGLIMFDVSGVSVRYHVVDIVPVAVIGVLGGILGSLYNYLLHKVLKLYNVINRKGKLHKLLLSLSVSIFTSVCLYGLPFLAKCRPCDSSVLDSACPSTGRTGNFKQFNCPEGYYNDLATLLLTTNDDAVKNIFSINTASEFNIFSLVIFFALYCILGLITFGIAVPSGLFLPIILMGSAYGRILGLTMGPYTKIDQGLYAVLGAASLMAGSMRMTVSLCVIFLELTNNLLLLPITMLVLLIAKTVGDCFNPSIYEIILELKGLPFLEPHPEAWMRNITVGELVDVKPPVVTLNGIEKVGRIVEVLKNTTHNGFPVVDYGITPPIGSPDGGNELHGLILRAHLILVLKKKWFLSESRRTEEWEVREKFTSIDLAERGATIEEVIVTKDDMEMYVDLHPLTNTTPYTVVESMSVAKAMVLFRQVGLRHMLILPKYQAAGVFPVVGILTRQDLIAHNILSAFPHLKRSTKKSH